MTSDDLDASLIAASAALAAARERIACRILTLDLGSVPVGTLSALADAEHLTRAAEDVFRARLAALGVVVPARREECAR